MYCSGRSSPLCQDIPSLLVAISLFFSPSILFPFVHLHCLAFHSWSCFVRVLFFWAKLVSCPVWNRTLFVQVQSLRAYQFISRSWEQLFSVLFLVIYMLLHLGLSEARLVKKHSYTRVVFAGGRGSWSELDLVYELYTMMVWGSASCYPTTCHINLLSI